MVKRNLRSTIQSDKTVSVKFKLSDQHVTGLVTVKLLACVGIVLDVRDLGVGKDGDVEVGCFFGLPVKPEAGRHFKRGEGHLGGAWLITNGKCWA